MQGDLLTQAIILCGGRGTRLNALYSDRPKVLVPVAGRPFLEWQLEWLARNGVRQVHLAAGHQAEVLRAWLQEAEGRGQVSRLRQGYGGQAGVRCQEDASAGEGRSSFDLVLSGIVVSVSLSVETEPLGTAGGLKFVESSIQSDPFLALNGDSLMLNLDFRGLAAAHRAGRTQWATIAVAPIKEPGRYGTVQFDDKGKITAFLEKAQRGTGWINGGVYLVSRCCLIDIEPGKNLSIETDIFPRLARDGRLFAFRGQPPLLDMGTPEGIRAMERFLTETGDRR